jgi:hypothetical protein
VRPVATWLERFRRPAAVPEAASEEVDAELMPVFAALDEIEVEATRLREEAEREATRRIDDAAVHAEHVLVRWQQRAEAERARAEAEQREAIAAHAHEVEVEAEREAERLRRRGRERIPVLVAEVLACITEDET